MFVREVEFTGKFSGRRYTLDTCRVETQPSDPEGGPGGLPFPHNKRSEDLRRKIPSLTLSYTVLWTEDTLVGVLPLTLSLRHQRTMYGTLDLLFL